MVDEVGFEVLRVVRFSSGGFGAVLARLDSYRIFKWRYQISFCGIAS